MIEALTRQQVWSAQQKWRETFARRLHVLTGRWNRGGADRYTFDHAFMEFFLTGVRAEEEYARAPAESLYVIVDEGRFGELRDCPNGVKPPLSEFSERMDAIIFPPDCTWTAATGPDYFDPVYFTYSEWVESTP
jgi:hypothetical protein